MKFLRRPCETGYARVKSEANPPVPTTKSLLSTPWSWPRPEVLSSDHIVELRMSEGSVSYQQWFVWERRGGENTHSPVPVWCYFCVAALAFESLGIGPYEVAIEWEKQASWDLAMIHRLWHAGRW